MLGLSFHLFRINLKTPQIFRTMAQPSLVIESLRELVLENQTKISKLQTTIREKAAYLSTNGSQSLVERYKIENDQLKSEIQKHVDLLSRLESRPNGEVLVSKTPTLCETKPSSKPPVSEPVKKAESATVKSKKEPKKKAAAPAQKEPEEDAEIDVGRLDLRVGKIVNIKKHPDADSLYVEEVDIGREKSITVVSGLVKHVPIDELNNSLVVILTNLKPAKMRGVTSEGMVMCASTPDKVEVMRPPSSAVPGDRILVPGYSDNRTPDPVMNPKKKIFETVAPDLKTDDALCATYKGVRWEVPGKGNVVSLTLKNVNVK